MTFWQRLKTQERNPPKCSCQRDERGHAVVTKNRGTKYVEGTEHQANHGDPFTHTQGCPHSELQLTTKPNEYLKAKDRFHQMAQKREAIRAARARNRQANRLARAERRAYDQSQDGRDRRSPAAPSTPAAQPVVSP